MMLQAKPPTRAAGRRLLIAGFFVAMTTALTGQTAQAQFTSGSDGSDGALDYTGQSGTIIFNPDDFVPPLDPDRDNVYHFTTITIPSGVTLRLRAPELNWAAVTWLATGLVRIDGVVNLSGEDGHGAGPRIPSIPGPGGYPGGAGNFSAVAAQAGFGPGGGVPSSVCFSQIYSCASHGNKCAGGTGQVTYGNILQQPMSGGSGGGGCPNDTGGAGGGAGGGALLIASSEEIRVTNGGGEIRADGGVGGDGGFGLGPTLLFAGSGGSIRLIAPTVGGGGILSVDGRISSAGVGYLRIESTEYTGLTIESFVPETMRIAGLTMNTPILTSQNMPSVRVVTIDGIPVPSAPAADFLNPDVVIDNDQPVVFEIEATNVAPGATADVYIYPNDFPLIVTTSTPLAGTLAFSTATATATVPPGLCVSTVRAILNP